MSNFIEVDEIYENDDLIDVYDIEVENTHCFFANNMLAHNCIGGNLAKIIFDNQDKNNLPEKFIDLEPNQYNLEKIQYELADMVEQFQNALGKENYYLELQFNSLNVQHLVNMHLIECSKRTGAPLIVTCDSHYANPKYWKEREIYKLMAQMGIMKKTPEELSSKIPQTIDELKCELYPKNANQLWETYLDTTSQYEFYNDTQIRDAIQLTHSIAHDQIGDVQIDKKVKLPSIKKIIEKDKLSALIEEIDDNLLSADEDYVAFQQLKKDAIEGAKWRKIQDKPEYIERLKEELLVIKKLKFSKYFLTYAKIMEVVSKEMLTGAGRGSASGSLLAFVLNITQIDPIKNGLLFERFLTRTKKCLHPEHWVKTKIDNKQLKNISIDDLVLTHNNEYKNIKYKESTLHNEIIDFELEDGTILTSSLNHKWIIRRNNKKIETFAFNVDILDNFISIDNKKTTIKKISKTKTNNIELIDIGVEGDHTFYVSDKENGHFYLTHNSFPDIDSDIAERNQALSLISDCFGEENVIPVSNFNQLQLRSLIKDVSKLQGLPFDEINMYTKNIEQEAMSEAKKEPGFDAQQWELTFEEAEENSPSFRELMKKYPEIEKTVKILFKQIKTTSRHAGGLVITNNALDNMPIIKSGGVLQTPWQEGLNFRHLEGFGFLKFDILGLGTLRIIENCIRRILKNRGQQYVSFEDVKDFYYQELHPDNNSMTDINVFKNVFWEYHYSGVFQFVQKNVQSFMAKMKPTSVLDLAVATSIFRPGPLSISADKLYLKNRENPKSISYKHPLLAEVLDSTAGLIIFQEQLQLIYHKLAGVALDQTDDIRKALLKKDKSNMEKTAKEQKRLRQDFIDRCLEVNQIPIEVSADIFDEMMKFVSYSFNKCLHKDTIVHTKERGMIKIKDVLIGDHVNSKNGFIAVKDVMKNGTKKLYKIKTKGGNEIICTMDHKIETPHGMETLGDIIKNDYKIICKNNNKNKCKICGKEYRVITHKHLRHKHNMTIEEYDLMFGKQNHSKTLSSEKSIAQRQSLMIGKKPWNYGLTKETETGLASIAEKMMDVNNPVFKIKDIEQ